MLESDARRRLRVGLFTAGLIALLAASILLIGKKQRLFVRQMRFVARFEHVAGLVAGAPVWMNGVVVGSVDGVSLPPDPEQREITVEFLVDATMARRVRTDSQVRIRTLGLLGDRYLEISSGSAARPRVKEGAEVIAVEPTDVTAFIAQGGDVVSNIVAISSSLRVILERIERGEGMLGKLTTDTAEGKEGITHLVSLLEQLDDSLHDVRAGRGVLGTLIADSEAGRKLAADVAALASSGRRVAELLAADLERQDSALAALLRDPQGRARVERVLDQAGQAAQSFAEFGKELTEGKGTLSRLAGDEELAGDLLDNLAALAASLRSVADKLDSGKGSAGHMINDPQLWEDLEHVIRGVNESKIMRWFIRNRREAGEKAEAKEEAEAAKSGPSPTPRPGD